MTQRRPLTEAEKDIIAEMRGRGSTNEQIARKLSRSKNTITDYCLRTGVDPEILPAYSLKRRSVGGAVLLCRDRTIRRFSDEEDEMLLRLAKEGVRPADIARRMGRRKNSIKLRLATLARHEERRERAGLQEAA